MSHAGLGAVIGYLLLGRKLGVRALAWGGFIGLLPCFDQVLFPLLQTTGEAWWHKGPSHSPVGIGIGAWAISLGLKKLWIRDSVSLLETAMFAFSIILGHVLLDCASLPGAALLWPVHHQRVSLNLIAQDDPILPILLAVFAIWLVVVKQPKPAKSRIKTPIVQTKRMRVCLLALGSVGIYLVLGGLLKWQAITGFTKDLAIKKVAYVRMIEGPTGKSFFLRRAVADLKSELWIGYRSVFQWSDTPVRWTIYPKGNEAFDQVRTSPEAVTLAELADGWWIARPHAKGAWLADLRISEARIWGSKKGAVDSRFPRSYLINPASTDDPVRALSPPARQTDEWKRNGRRILGDYSSWEANPRLAGVPGSLPEFLPIKE